MWLLLLRPQPAVMRLVKATLQNFAVVSTVSVFIRILASSLFTLNLEILTASNTQFPRMREMAIIS